MKMETKGDEAISPKSLISDKKVNVNKPRLINDDSGYSSDSSAASASYSSLNLRLRNNSGISKEILNHFPTPDVNWKSKLRCSSTPLTTAKLETKKVYTPEFQPIEGPLLRSKTFPSPSVSSISLNLNLSLNIPSLEESPSYSVTTRAAKEKKTSNILRSPLKSPFKLIKKQKSEENIASTGSTQTEDVFSNPDVRQRTVKALFFSKLESSPIRRTSPRLSNILTRLIDDACYILPNVFAFLSSRDLVSVSHSCRQLNSVIESSKQLLSRKKTYLEGCKKEFERVGKENLKAKGTPTVIDPQFSIRRSPRKHLGQLQNTFASPQKAVPPRTPTRFERFVKEGKKLLPGESQEKCVHCQCPARLTPGEAKASCSNESCGAVYCTRCSLPFHTKPSECLALKPKPRISYASKILSKACKKRLRRL